MARPNSTQATSFACFPKLPREIQLNIWEYSLPPPRMIRIGKRECPPAQPWQVVRTYRTTSNLYRLVWLERRPVPAILHACADSREVGLKHYDLILDTITRLDLSLPSFNKRKKPGYVDLARDILVIRSRSYLSAFLKYTPETVLNRIHCFAYSYSYDSFHWSPGFEELMKGLPALDGLAIISDRIRRSEYLHKLTLDFFTKLKNDGETVPKIRTFGDEKEFEKALQDKKLWGAESAEGWLEPFRPSSVENIL